MKQKGQNHEYKPVRVYSTFDQINLLLAKMALQREEIPYETRNENFAAVYPGADGMATVDIFVDQSDAAKAREILKSFIEGEKEK